MRELVDLAAVERLFNILAVLAPIVGIGIGALVQSRACRPGALITGFLLGLLGPANWLLWRIYNGIEDHYGLDSVKAMLINLALFAALGIGVGLALRLLRRSGDSMQGSSSDPERLNA
jgi:hypothetical protein